MQTKGYKELVRLTKQQRIERINRMQELGIKPGIIATIEGCSRQAVWKVLNEVDHGNQNR